MATMIAPLDLFDYEIIEDGESASTTIGLLSKKTARITKIKPEYCNTGGYTNLETSVEYLDTNYSINYNGILPENVDLSERLVIPYEVKLNPTGKIDEENGDIYTITEVCLEVEDPEGTANLPSVDEIIYPNTILRIFNNDNVRDIRKPNYLITVNLSENLKEIPEDFFMNCTNLTTITIPNSVESIGDNVFYKCSSLANVTIPDSITSIGDFAFYCCKLTSIVIHNSVSSIGNSTFAWCESLTNITIPENVTSIGEYAFSGTPWLDNKRDYNPLVVVNNILIDGERCSGDILISNGVTSIGDGAFIECSNLTSITIPNSVTSVGDYAFRDCYNLTTINIRGEANSISNSPWGATNATVNWNYTGE